MIKYSLKTIVAYRSEYKAYIKGFPDSSVGKQFTCNARDLSSIPGSGRSAVEGIGYILVFLDFPCVVQLIKNLPETWETWV